MTRDHYLNFDNFVERLREELHKYGTLIVAYDYDDTVHDFHKKGREYNDIISLLQRLDKLGIAKFIVYTCSERERYIEIGNYLSENNIPWDSINCQPEGISGKVPTGEKLYYNVLLDDRAGLQMPYWALNMICSEIEKQRGM